MIPVCNLLCSMKFIKDLIVRFSWVELLYAFEYLLMSAISFIPKNGFILGVPVQKLLATCLEPHAKLWYRFDYSVCSKRVELFYPEIRKYYPNLKDGSLQPGYSGIRPKLSGPRQSPTDFLIQVISCTLLMAELRHSMFFNQNKIPRHLNSHKKCSLPWSGWNFYSIIRVSWMWPVCCVCLHNNILLLAATNFTHFHFD